MRASLRIGLLALAFALATAVFGWWTVPLLGAAWGGVAATTRLPAFTAGIAAALGWLMLLAWTATQGPVWALAQKVGGVLALPGWLFAVLTVAFAALLAESAAGVVSGLVRARNTLP